MTNLNSYNDFLLTVLPRIIEEEESAPEEDDADEVDMEEAQLSLFPTLRRLSDLTFSQLELPIDLMRFAV